MPTALPFGLAAALLCLPLVWNDALTTSSLDSDSDWPPEATPLLRFFWWITRLYCVLVHRLVVLDDPGLPRTGPLILVANHTSGVDHFLLQGSCRRVLGFMIAKEFYDVPVGGWFCRKLGCIPVNRDGKDLAAARAALRALKDGRVVPIFPEGRILRTSGEEFGEGRPGAAFLALKSGVPVIPVYIRGTPIVPGVWPAWYTPSKARIYFGRPIDLSDLVGLDELDHGGEKRELSETTRRLMDAIQALREPSLEAEAARD